MGGIAVVFPGQGSQYVGMGQGFLQASSQARELMQMAEKASGLALQRLCLEGPLEELTLTVNLQPAMAVLDLICWQALQDAGVRPLAVAGHSLGEYPALAAAGALSLEECLKLVALRGRLMEREAGKRPGAMSAVMGLAPEEVAALTQEAGGVVQPANYNTPQQTVITGEAQAVARAGQLAKSKGAKAIPLKVSGAWHSPLMEQAAVEMRAALEPLEFKPLTAAHVPNTTGQPTQDAQEAKAQIMGQLTAPVRWVQTIQALLALGVDTFIEAGPKNVLAGLIKKTAPAETKVLGVEDPQSLSQALAALG